MGILGVWRCPLNPELADPGLLNLIGLRGVARGLLTKVIALMASSPTVLFGCSGTVIRFLIPMLWDEVPSASG
jgi:hypothetical protein